MSSTSYKETLPVEFDDIASIDKPSDGYGAKVHGVVPSLLPIKGTENKKYFDGSITDGTKKIRFVGFSPVNWKNLLMISRQLFLAIVALKMRSMGATA